VSIGKDRHRILTLLRSNEYHLGIAEFGQMAGSFALFHELGITNTIATSALPPEPSYMIIFGAHFSMQIPGFSIFLFCSNIDISKIIKYNIIYSYLILLLSFCRGKKY
jgi:hypothetical protein